MTEKLVSGMTTSLKRAFELEPLEPRVLLSADLATGGIATATATAATNIALTDAQQKELLNGSDVAVAYSPEAQVESILNFGNIVRASVIANYYWIHTYIGLPGNNFLGILKPKLTLNLFKDLSIGLEHIIYYDDRYPRGEDPRPNQHFVRTEQKFFLQYFFENSQRGGRFN